MAYQSNHQVILSIHDCPLSPFHILLPLLIVCASDHSACPFSVYLCFSVNPSSVFSLLDSGTRETQAWDLSLPQLPHPLHRHSVPSRFWLSGPWSQLGSQSRHPTPSLHHPFRHCLAEKERVLHWGPAAGSLRYSRTAVCHQVPEPFNSVVLAPLLYIGSTAGLFRLTWLVVTQTNNRPELIVKLHHWLIVLSLIQDSPAPAGG